MRDAGWCESASVELLWKEKTRMDAVFDGGNGHLYQRVRDEVCPLDSKGSSTFWNRAGDKLKEVYDCIPFFGSQDGTCR